MLKTPRKKPAKPMPSEDQFLAKATALKSQFGNYDLQPDESRPPLSVDAVREKVKSQLSDNGYNALRPEKASTTTKHRNKAVDTLMKRIQSGKVKPCSKKEDSDVQKKTISLRELLGFGNVKLYEKAIKEEQNSLEFAEAGYLAAQFQKEGPPRDCPWVLQIGGASGTAKTTVAKLLGKQKINGAMAKPVTNEEAGRESETVIHDFVGADNGPIRELSQIRQIFLEAALALGYSGISDLEEYGIKLKDKIETATTTSMIDYAELRKKGEEPEFTPPNLVIPNTFVSDESTIMKTVETTKGAFSGRKKSKARQKRKEALERLEALEKETDPEGSPLIECDFALTRPKQLENETPEEAEQRVRDVTEVLGVQRAFKTRKDIEKGRKKKEATKPKRQDTAFDLDYIQINNRRIGTESKAYPVEKERTRFVRRYFGSDNSSYGAGAIFSKRAAEKFKQRTGKDYIGIESDLMALVETSSINVKRWQHGDPITSHVFVLSDREYKQWVKEGRKGRLQTWLDEYRDRLDIEGNKIGFSAPYLIQNGVNIPTSSQEAPSVSQAVPPPPPRRVQAARSALASSNPAHPGPPRRVRFGPDQVREFDNSEAPAQVRNPGRMIFSSKTRAGIPKPSQTTSPGAGAELSSLFRVTSAQRPEIQAAPGDTPTVPTAAQHQGSGLQPMFAHNSPGRPALTHSEGGGVEAAPGVHQPSSTPQARQTLPSVNSFRDFLDTHQSELKSEFHIESVNKNPTTLPNGALDAVELNLKIEDSPVKAFVQATAEDPQSLNYSLEDSEPRLSDDGVIESIKSITELAVQHAIEKGRLSLNDKEVADVTEFDLNDTPRDLRPHVSAALQVAIAKAKEQDPEVEQYISIINAPSQRARM